MTKEYNSYRLFNTRTGEPLARLGGFDCSTLDAALEFCGYAVIENEADYKELFADLDMPGVYDDWQPGINVYNTDDGACCGAYADIALEKIIKIRSI